MSAHSNATSVQDNSISIKDRERLRLLQIDAAATGSVVPLSNEVGEATWSLAPTTFATIRTTGIWTDMPQNTLNFHLDRESHVIVRYQMVVRASKSSHAGGDFLNDHQTASTTVSDYLGARLLLDGMPHRQSGSHAAPLGAYESSTRQMSGYIVTRLGAGDHQVTLQWRKWGSAVSSWSVDSTSRDGFVSGRSLSVTSQQRYLWYVQPLSVARTAVSASSNNQWHPIKDMHIQFQLPRKWMLRIRYSLQARPQGVPNADVLAASTDWLSVRIVLDGQAYRESSSVTYSATSTTGCSTLSGEVTLSIPRGEHSVRLEWKKYGTNVPLWWSHPNFLDGFVGGRLLSVTGEMHPYTVAQPLGEAEPLRSSMASNLVAGSGSSSSSNHSSSSSNHSSSSSNHSNVWRDIESTSVAFLLDDVGQVTFSYDLGLAQLGFGGGSPFDSWTWDRWSSVATRLVVDERAFVHSGSSTNAHVRTSEVLRGEVTLKLPKGPHTARLQWRTFGESIGEWRTFQDKLDG
jgi:hypothetical protein